MSDYTLYKFRKVNKYFLDSLVKSNLHFALPKALNDPYDCQLDMKHLFGSAHHSSTYDFASNNREISKFGVCSFSTIQNNQMLWAHYADGHHGVCVTYKISEDFIKNTDNKIIGIFDVNYGDGLLADFRSNYDFNNLGRIIHFPREAMKKVLTTKGPDWAYEKESRIVRTESSNLDIPPEFLVEMCFGLRTPNSDKSLIKEIIAVKYTNVVFKELQKGESEFGIRMVDI